MSNIHHLTTIKSEECIFLSLFILWGLGKHKSTLNYSSCIEESTTDLYSIHNDYFITTGTMHIPVRVLLCSMTTAVKIITLYASFHSWLEHVPSWKVKKDLGKSEHGQI